MRGGEGAEEETDTHPVPEATAVTQELKLQQLGPFSNSFHHSLVASIQDFRVFSNGGSRSLGAASVSPRTLARPPTPTHTVSAETQQL